MKKGPSYPLRMPPSMRESLNALALAEGSSLNHLICIAIAEKLARVQHAAWHGEERRKLNQTFRNSRQEST
ncbi:hypothetical protein SAMN05443244_0926 [Terriglobus roseus]|uniref:HicB family protein n=1 Tax=Terriglobus roseus TaxID=392734 RepID=A0A1H4K1B9_9BACT|nr:hypothetical protein SAMN05443244_0926 [Terriglobus roseus]